MDESQEKEEQQTSEPIIQPIIDLGSSLIQTDKGTIYVLTIVGQIEGHQMLPPSSKSTKYEHVLPLLATVEESPQIDGLLILLNNGGGDVEAGLAISELIASMSKPTVSLVLGGSHSIGELAADVGSVIYGEEAVELGLIDQIGGLSDALSCLHGMIEDRKQAIETGGRE